MTPGETATENHSSAKHSSSAVILLHGLTGTPAEMRAYAKKFELLGVHTVNPLLAGHGGSNNDLLAVTWKDWLNTVTTAVRLTQKDYKHVFIVGVSMSSLLAVLAAAEIPTVSGIVLLSPHYGPYARGTDWRKIFLPLLYKMPDWVHRWIYWEETPPYGMKDERLQRRIKAQLDRNSHGDGGEHGLFRTYVKYFYQLHQLQNQIHQVAAKVHCPALVIHSVEDTVMDPMCGAMLYRDLGTTRKTLRIINDSDHVMMLDLRKLDVFQWIYQFIQTHTPEVTEFLNRANEQPQSHTA
ncbi:MAG: alpha/beta fold hydrolase [Cyanobacteria bacterium]|nr:alpha/beta fold hydrolase [Cyanobacteriota bacterium]